MKNSNLIIRHVLVDRKLRNESAIKATGRKQYVSTELIDEIPKHNEEEVDIFFFFCKNKVSNEELKRKYEFYNLKPDPIAQCAYNEANPSFADSHPNVSQWQDSKGNWCQMDFDSFKGERRVGLRQYGTGFPPGLWFCGVR